MPKDYVDIANTPKLLIRLLWCRCESDWIVVSPWTLAHILRNGACALILITVTLLTIIKTTDLLQFLGQ